MTTDPLGRFDFYAADGRYDIVISGTGPTAFTQSNVEIADLTEKNAGDTPASMTFKQFQNSIYYADQYCAGSLDVGVCINNALAALPTVSSYKYGTIRLDGFTAGTSWVWSTLVTVNSPGVSIIGPGSAYLSIAASTLNGDHLRIQANPFSVTQAGVFGGFALNGGSQASAVCVHIGDIIGAALIDLRCTGFTGASAVGLWMDNVTNFTERTLLERVHMDGNTKGFKFTNSGGSTNNQSFGYTRMLDAKCNANANQTCLSFEGGILQNSLVTLNVNMAANTATSVSLTGLEYSGGPGSLWIDNVYDIVAECTGCTSGVLLSTASGTTLTGTGIIHSLTTGTTSSISGTAQMYLPYGDPLQTYSNGKQLNVGTASSATSGANFNSPALGILGSYWNGSAAATDSWTFTNTLGSGTNPTSTLKLGKAGSSGASNIDFTGPTMSISSFELGAVYGTVGQFQFNSNNGGVSVAGVSATGFSITNPATLNAHAFDLSGNIGSAGYHGHVEMAAPSGTAGASKIWADSTAHKLKANNNNTGAVTFAYTDLAQSFTAAQTLGSGGSLNASNLLISPTAPTVSSGFGTSPSIATNNGTASFSINVGTGGAATTGVIGLPTAANGWSCTCSDITTSSTTVFLCKQTASTTTTATIGNFNTAGAAAAWVASDIVNVSCFAR